MKIAGLIGGLGPESTMDYYRRIIEACDPREIGRLADAHADFGAITANTPHILFDEVRARSAIPLISIVEATSSAARSAGLKRLGLLGTRFTMREHLYPDAVVPSADVDRMIDRHHIDGLILGGTELPLLLREESHHGVPFLVTTKIHVEAIVQELMK